MSRVPCAWPALASIVLALAAPVAHAQFLQASGSCSPVVGGNLPFDPTFNPQCSSATGGTWTDPRPGTTNSANWTAQVNYGTYAVSAASSLSSLPPLGSSTPLAFGVSASGFARSNDTLTVNVPGLAGQRGRISGSIVVDGSMTGVVSSSVASTFASWGVEAQVIQGGAFRGGGSANGEFRNFAGTPSGEAFVDRLVPISAEVVFGSPFVLDIRLNASASATVRPEGAPGSPTYLLPVTASAGAAFGNTALWNGLQSVTLLNGTAVTGWTVSSLSGLDYAQPIPEPATWATLALGLGVVGAIARARRRAA